MTGISKDLPHKKWLRNFGQTVSRLIADQRGRGMTVKNIVLTEGLLIKLYEALGYETSDYLGYRLELMERTDEEIKNEVEMIFIDGYPLN